MTKARMTMHERNRRWLGRALAIATILCAAGAAWAVILDFENGTDGATVNSGDPSITFAPSGGFQWVYGDWRVEDPNDPGNPKYNGPYPDGALWSEGNFFAWMGKDRNEGLITFTGDVSDVSVGYSSSYGMTLEAYNAANVLIDTDTGGINSSTGALDILTVEGDISYVKIISLGNHWIIDNFETNVEPICTEDADCDDSVFCNGAERCVDNECLPAEAPVDCPDDGLWCTGEEFCDESIADCGHQNAPDCGDDGLYCNGGPFCNEDSDMCDEQDPPECPDDGQYCNGIEVCDEDIDDCGHDQVPICPDDGKYCNGADYCDEDSDSCLTGEPPVCPDDGEFCNGPEICSDDEGACISAGNPCDNDEICDEDEARCVTGDPPTPVPGWPQGDITGGCCSC